MTLLGCAVGIGMLMTAQRMAVFMEGYLVGQRMRQAHEQEVALGWIDNTVTGSSSPTALARQERDRQWNFVAWSSLDDVPLQPLPVSASSEHETEHVAMASDTAD